MLEKLELIAQVHEGNLFTFEIQSQKISGNPVIALQHLEISYGEKKVLRKIYQALNVGSRVGLIGPNGAGKSTFMRFLAEKHQDYKGEVIKSNKLKIGYFAQDQLELLKSNESAYHHVQELNPKLSESEIRKYLGSFNFCGDEVFRPVQTFSGGEKARLVLALICWSKPNLLLFDEPTNHLDMEMRDALNMALQEFQGPMVIVSHDRFFLKSIVDEFWLVANQTVQRFEGNLEDYQEWFIQQAKSQNSKSEQHIKSAKNRAEKNQIALDKLERQLENIQNEKKLLDKKLNYLYLNQEKNSIQLEKLLEQRSVLDTKIQTLETKILTLIDQM